MVLLAASSQSSFGFSPAGPTNSEAWQVGEIGYQLPGDIVTPKNLGEEYRRTTPVLFYAFDSNFRDYFGSNGVRAVEEAISVFNNITNLSQYSRILSEIPLQAHREKYAAESLFLSDLKSYALNMLCENMGLAEPERYTWCLHDRLHVGTPPCPTNMLYTVVQRNFDPVPSPLDQFQTSSYVNGTLYSYFILEFCAPPNPVAIAISFPVDPLADPFTSIAGAINPFQVGGSQRLGGLTPFGRFFTGLTRDDVGGLRYLLRTNNLNLEATLSNTLTFVTNVAPQLLFTSNLTVLAAQALTNDAPTLQALYPGLAIAATTNTFVNVLVTNVSAYFTNFPWDLSGTPAHLAFATNLTYSVQTLFHHSFANLVTFQFRNGHWLAVPVADISTLTNRALVTLQTTNITVNSNPWGPAGSLVIATNVTTFTYVTNQVVGDFFLMPSTNCDVAILAGQLTNVLAVTNIILIATNTTANTNVLGTPLFFTESRIDTFTNHVFVINPISCQTNLVAWRQGIDRVTFVRVPDGNFDELTYGLYTPITNDYSVMAFNPTNNVLSLERNRRTLVFPDITFTASDFADIPGNNTIGTSPFARNVNFLSSTNFGVAYQNLAGPGIIEPITVFFFNKSGPIFGNVSPTAYFIDPSAEASQIPLLIWGSFDGTTNAPIVYPNGTSVENLENQILIQISPTTLPDGAVSNGYPTTTFTANGGQPPYSWGLAPGSPGLPPGLTLSSGGTISGTPTLDGIFDFVLQLSDSAGTVVDYNLAITIIP